MASHAFFCAVSLLATLAVIITNYSPHDTLLYLYNGRDNNDGSSRGARNVNLLIDISMVAGGIKKSLHHTFSSVPEEKLFRAIMSVLTDVEVDNIEHDIRSGIDSLIDNDFVLQDDGFLPESLNDPIVKNNDFREQIHDDDIIDTKETAAIQGSTKKATILTDFNQESKRYIALDHFVSKNDESSHQLSIRPIIENPTKNEFHKSYHSEAVSHTKETTKTVTSTERRRHLLGSNLHLTKKKRPKSHSTQHVAVKDDISFMEEDENNKDTLIVTSEIESHRHLIECGDDEIAGEIDVKMTSKSKGLIWDVYQNKSDMTLMKGYGQDGKKEICFKKNLCYVFRLHDNTVKNYKITLGGFLVKEGNIASAGQLVKFGWNSCCNTSCCASYEAQAEIMIEANDSTEALTWNLVMTKDTDGVQQIVVEGGSYDNPMETNTYITHTCINPTICHTLQVFGNNETNSNGNVPSYNSIKVYVNGEVKARDWDVMPGKNIQFCSICSTKPMLIQFKEKGSADERAIDIMNRLSFVSSADLFVDIASAQYRAICWIIFDDLRQIEATSISLIQRYVLAVLYYETNGDEWVFQNGIRKPNFLSQENECKWLWTIDETPVGVRCINETVTEIVLLKSNLRGILPSEITSLQKLQTLNLKSNELVESIPKEIGNLKYLSKLNMDDNKIGGSLPASFYDLLNLEYLYLEQNKITGTISSLIGQLKLLKKWRISKNQFSGTIPEEIYGLNDLEDLFIYKNLFTGTISPRIGQLSKLYRMMANYNMLQGSIPSNFGLTSIYFLDLESNDLTGTIPTELMQLNLANLFISRNKLEGSIPQQIEDIGTLNILDLSYNYLSGTLPSFPENITAIYLHSNNFNGTVPVELSELHLLESLQLDDNNFFGTVPSEVCGLRANRLSIFSTDCNGYYLTPKVNCSCCTYCRDDFTDREKLGSCPDDELIVTMTYGNLFTWYSKYWTVQDSTKQVVNGDEYGRIYDTPEQSSYRSCFASTDCYEFTIGGGDYTYYNYPEDHLSFTIIYNDTMIYDNDDGNNQMWRGKIQFGYSSTFNGPKLNECDNIIFENKELAAGTQEYIAYNQIRRMSGPTIDSSMTKAMQWIQNDTLKVDTSNIYRWRQRYVLVMLFYSTGGPNWTNKGNFASSEHECQWLGITCDKTYGLIESISLMNNNLDGTLPHELGELLKLKILNLSQNSGLVSTIPDGFANLWSLETLDLSHCGIEGSIPSVIGNLNNLVYLNLGHNRVNMSIPVETRNLTQLEELYLNDNWLTGIIPNLSTITKLKVLDLSNNNIRGGVSRGAISFKSLATFNIGNNLIKGTLPFDITQAVNLRKLDMSGNLFLGSIPYGFGNLRDLQSVLLGKNKLHGDIPEDLFGIVSLEELNLQDNMLMGTIPTNLGKMTALRHLALNHNALKGTIPMNIKNLRKLQIVHIHGNTFTGTEGLMTDCDEIWGDSSGRSFISDCGIPSKVESQLECKCCTICCNADGSCQVNINAEKLQEPIVISFIIISALIIGYIVLRNILEQVRHRFKLPDYNFDLVEAFGDDSVYFFMLANDWKCWTCAVSTAIGQVGVFCIFLKASSTTYTYSDWEYSLRCFPDSESCIDTKRISWIGWCFFGTIIVFFLGRDIIKGMQILYVSAKSGSHRCLFGGLAILTVTNFAIAASSYYNYAIAYTDSQIILNAVVLAIVTDIDEKAYELIRTINKPWVEKKIKEAEEFTAVLEEKMNHHQHNIHNHGDGSDDVENSDNTEEEIELESLDTNEAPLNDIERMGNDRDSVGDDYVEKIAYNMRTIEERIHKPIRALFEQNKQISYCHQEK